MFLLSVQARQVDYLSSEISHKMSMTSFMEVNCVVRRANKRRKVERVISSLMNRLKEFK